MTSELSKQILPYWKIVYIFKIVERNQLKLCMWIQIAKVKNIVLVLWSPRQQISFQTSLFLKQQYLFSLHECQIFSRWN